MPPPRPHIEIKKLERDVDTEHDDDDSSDDCGDDDDDEFVP